MRTVADPSKVSRLGPGRDVFTGGASRGGSPSRRERHPVLDLQQSVGNRAVRRILLRSQGALVQRQPAPPALAGVTTRRYVDDKTAALIQSALAQSQVLKPYIEDKLKTTTIPGKKFVHHDSDAEFESAYTKLHKISTGSEEMENVEGVRGFYHRPTDTIHLRPRSNTGDAVHEAIHKLSSPGFRGYFGGFLDEGVTQYFTDLVLEEQKLDKMTTHKYKAQLACAERLVGRTSRHLVAQKYFRWEGNLPNELARALGISLVDLAKLRGERLCQKV